MARDNIYILSQILVLLRPKTGGFITRILQCGRCRWRCVLSFDLLEFFFVLVGSHILHLAQFVQLAQGQACLAQIVQSGLAVVLAHILIGLGLTLVDFVEYHEYIYYRPGTPPGAGAAEPGCAVGTGATPPCGAPASTPVSAPASSCPMARSCSRPAGVTPMLRRS